MSKTQRMQKFQDKVAKNLFGRERSKSSCVSCGKPITKFNDIISEREFKISGLCQKCQDEIFG